MRILIVNKSLIPVTLYGGTERVIWYLGKELSKLGHKITYLVKNGSTCDFGTIIPIDDTKDIIEQIPDNVDIVHFNFSPPNIDQIKKPYIVTMHGNANTTNELNINTVFVSKNHANRFGSESYVYNGLDWEDYTKPNLTTKRDSFHFLGKAAWRLKNVQGAIDVIKGTKAERLKVLGGTRLNISMGFRFTTSPRVTFYGMIGGTKKDAILNKSKGLIFPVKWHEPFGLALTESLYYGAPVFGTPYGSLPELITEEVGFLSNKKADLVNAVSNVSSFSKKTCHDYAVENFNSKKMALSYLDKYETILSNQKINLKSPQLIAPLKNKFLDWY
ncbi:glycosyltransferase [Cellulophaga sp. HaHaR_3_176]|uniref:glycosyltransferase n=1 Tax=Cellulophaga sp. HaHaR_3_176 TaxID=1942464 RepID=UPI001C1F3F57|nr:glycosyltransferase [Cellulophaga sp. HaHaR_3_176]QWX82672.1 glycosyltransferase [Cellulophaga sp. HaHaR_3_176]